MTIREPLFLQDGSHAAEDVRLLIEALLGGSQHGTTNSGIVAATDFAVTASNTPDANVHVASGTAFISGTEGASQGVYTFISDASVTVAMAPPDATNDRISLIVLQVVDFAYSGLTSAGKIVEVAGAPSATPTAPTPPDNSITLAQVRVVASSGAATISASNITDARQFQLPGARATIVADVTNATTVTAVNNQSPVTVVSMSVAVAAGQKYAINAYANGAQSGAGGAVVISVTCSDSAFPAWSLANNPSVPSSYSVMGGSSRVYAATANGTVTFTITMQMTSATASTFKISAQQAELSAVIG